MISMDKKYQTREGKDVRLYAVDGAGPQAVHGAIKNDGAWEVETWDSGGRYVAGDPLPRGCDLIEVPKEHTGWLNFYADGFHSDVLHASRKSADTDAGPGRIACIQVTFCEGEGL
jgi:hypothetical protein